MIVLEALTIVAAYLLGSVSFARMVARRRLPGEDISTTTFDVEGSNEKWVYSGVSAASVTPRAGARWGLLVVLLDGLKALVPTLAARLIWPDGSVYLAVALAVVIGHIWPIWHGFAGGRGQSPILGAMLVINVFAIPFALIIGMLVGLTVFTSAHLAREGSPFFYPIWFLAVDGPGPELAFSLVLAAVFWLGNLPEIREARRIRHAAGVDRLPWPARFNAAFREFFGLGTPD